MYYDQISDASMLQPRAVHIPVEARRLARFERSEIGDDVSSQDATPATEDVRLFDFAALAGIG